jgi:hypothetical protein
MLFLSSFFVETHNNMKYNKVLLNSFKEPTTSQVCVVIVAKQSNVNCKINSLTSKMLQS